jgi:hypothetical protein
MKLSYSSISVLFLVLLLGVPAQAVDSDEPIVGRWFFPMGQTYVFKTDGTFTGEPSLSGTWKRGRMDDKTTAIEYRLYFSSGGPDKPEILTLTRGDREGHEYESGHLLRLNQQMRVKKLPDKADDNFSANTDSRSTETKRPHHSSEAEYDGQIGGTQAVFHLRINDPEIAGTYSQGNNTYRIQGKLEKGRMLLDEYTGERLTAHIRLNPDGGEDSWKGTMSNVYPDKKQFPVTLSRVR